MPVKRRSNQRGEPEAVGGEAGDLVFLRTRKLAWLPESWRVASGKFNRLQLAQAEGQGIPTMFRLMLEEGCPPPILEADGVRVLCVLRANPRALREVPSP